MTTPNALTAPNAPNVLTTPNAPTAPNAPTMPTGLDIDSADSADVNVASSAGQQRHGQRQTSDSLMPTPRNWENTRSLRV